MTIAHDTSYSQQMSSSSKKQLGEKASWDAGIKYFQN